MVVGSDVGVAIVAGAAGAGVLLWSMLSGHRPWPQLSSLEAARRHADGARMDAPGGALGNASLHDIAQRCWQQSARERPVLSQMSNAGHVGYRPSCEGVLGRRLAISEFDRSRR